MPRTPKPWYWKARKAWYVVLNGKKLRLHEDKQKAQRQFHELMSKPEEPKEVVRCDSLFAIIDLFLEWAEVNRRPDTYRWYLDRLNDFCTTLEDITAMSLRPYHVQQWVDAKDWSDGSKRNAIRAIKRAMKWAVDQGHLSVSPIASMKKPRGGKREQVITEKEYKAILKRCDPAFRDLLVTHWLTGCRPQQSLRVEAQHFDPANQRWVFPESLGKTGLEIVYLPPEALRITKRLVKRYPQGKLFRNQDDNPWMPDAVNCRFTRMRKTLKIKYSLYAFRHTWINRMLQNGVDSLTVAFLANHRDPSMLAKYYAHLTQNPEHMLAQAKKAAS